MKKNILLAFMMIVAAVVPVRAWNIADALKGLGKGESGGNTGLESVIGNLLSTGKITISQMEGTWRYSAPAVTFKSDNVLKKAGGAAASAVVVEKLTPIYNKTGFNNAELTVNADSSFVLKANKITLKGNISTFEAAKGNDDSQANFVFNFTVGGKMKIGKMDAYVTKSATGTLSVMFDVSRLITLMDAVGKVSGNSTVKSAVSMLKSYDGLCAGFEMKKK